LKKPFIKDIWRSITHSKGRFWAIFIIVALGAGFYTGLRSTAPDMRATIDQYCDDNHMMDIQIMSTMGLTDEDVEQIRSTDGVSEVMAGYVTDQISRIGEKDSVIRVHSIPNNPSENNDSFLNRMVLVEGRMPQKEGECVLYDAMLGHDVVDVGSVITLQDDGTLSDSLKYDEYTVVGLVSTPYYLSFSLGESEIGSGTLDYFMYVLEDNFTQEVYTDVYATVEGAAELNAFETEYEDTVSEVTQRLEDLAEVRETVRYDEIKQEAETELDDAQAELDDNRITAEEELTQAEQELTDAQIQIEENEKLLQENEQKLKDSEATLKQKQQEYDDGVAAFNEAKQQTETQLSEAQKQLDSKAVELSEQKAQLEDTYQQLLSQKEQIDAAKAFVAGLKTQRDDLNQLLQQAQQAGDTQAAEQYQQQITQLDQQIEQYQSQIDAYDQGVAECESGLSQIAAGEQALSQQQELLNQNRSEAMAVLDEKQAALTSAKEQLDSGWDQLKDGKQQLEDGKTSLEDAKQQLADGQAEYDSKREEVEQTLSDAQQEIDDNREKLNDLAYPEWYVLDRQSNVGFVSFSGDCDRMDSLSSVFPFIFFLVAALVSLTTMTRMVEEERSLIGTYKALGFSKSKIALKYLLYAFSATVLGSVFGIIICEKLLPVVCWNSYRIMYVGPDLATPIHMEYVLIGSAASVACTLGATLFACWNSLSEKPAVLLLPRTPKAGKRILLERITPIWKRLKFTHKVTARNLFRYKKRLFMTVIGIAGCTALLLTGFGIKDSVSGIITNQYEEIYQYNITVGLKDNSLSEETKSLLDRESELSDYMLTYTKRSEVSKGENTISAYITVPEDPDRFKEMITLRTRRGHHDILFDDDSVVVSEKLAEKLGVSVGGSLNVEADNGEVKQVTVTGITENYIENYVYLSPQIYEEINGHAPEYTQLIGIYSDDEAQQQEFSAKLLGQDDISTVQFVKDMGESFNTMIESLDYIILVLIICAGLLAFVVLYNLTNINITERVREIATIKVLGFFDREVGAYIYRETGILTAIGCLCGLVLGIILHRFVIGTVEVDMVMFGRDVEPMSFVYSVALTILFLILVDIVMYRKLQKVSMVESLKSVD
jgi:putative ABC transport system permease protein